MLKDPCRFVSFLSCISVIFSFVALLLVVRYCCPELEENLRNVIGGVDTAPVRQAFHVMADGLEAGIPVKETVKEAVQVFIG